MFSFASLIKGLDKNTIIERGVRDSRNAPKSDVSSWFVLHSVHMWQIQRSFLDFKNRMVWSEMTRTRYQVKQTTRLRLSWRSTFNQQTHIYGRGVQPCGTFFDSFLSAVNADVENIQCDDAELHWLKPICSQPVLISISSTRLEVKMTDCLS